MKALGIIGVLLSIGFVFWHLFTFFNAWSSLHSQGLSNGTLALAYFGLPLFTVVGSIPPALALGCAAAPSWMQEFASSTPGKAWGLVGGSLVGLFVPNLVLLGYSWVALWFIHWLKS